LSISKKEDKTSLAKCREDSILETRAAIQENLTGTPELCRPCENAFAVKTLLDPRNKIEFLV